MLPFESMPSPSASTVIFPPEIFMLQLSSAAIGSDCRAELESDDAALNPSSLETTLTVPPEIFMDCPSSPSQLSEMFIFPSFTVSDVPE